MTSGAKITPTRRDDIPELSQFLIRGFGAMQNPSVLTRDVLLWKYFDGPSGPSGDSDCSLIARSAGRIVGHVGISHRQLIVSGDGALSVPTMHANDWLASAEYPGLGIFLMLQALATSKTQFAVGGAPSAQAVFPRLGFEQKTKSFTFRKVLTPSQRLRASEEGLFRKWAGTAKNIASGWLERTPPLTQTVELRSVATFTEEIDCLQQQPWLRIAMCRRDHVLLNHLLRSPVPGFSGWTIHTPQRMIGYAVLKITAEGRIRFGRIVDCWLDTEDPSFWQAAVAALTDRLRALSVYYVMVRPVSPSLHAALLLNGFAKVRELNVYVRDKQQLLPQNVLFGLSNLDADSGIH